MNYAEATNEDTLDQVTYCAGKAMAECAARDFTATEGPSFDLVNIYPPCVYGPIKNGIVSLVNMNTSSTEIYRLMSPIS
ncbi:hypothetical protein BDV23DRAFT_149174 [Aspergillus alliaceus]|uniref:NAD-dependent epimerase/dehydratase domain-containing protein n=1 Tax=Petromyces alliaceus TaxID=209559 RepID=A0A5N7CGX6_PETAA|nr:hypothetical protein BDV23DRAFT_149174 [Aspergillus alliaceus]